LPSRTQETKNGTDAGSAEEPGESTLALSSAPILTKSSRSTEDVIRGSTNIPLSLDGRAQAKERGIQFARKGGIDLIYSSSLGRAVETAQFVHKANSKARFAETTRSLHPWHMGGYEGKPTMKVLPMMNDLILNHPDKMPPPAPGDSNSTNKTGETYHQFERRVMDFVGPGLKRYLMDPEQKILWVTHYRDLKLLQGWESAGFPQDLHIDRAEVIRKDGEPGQVSRLWATDIHETPEGMWGTWHLAKVNMESLDKLKGGIYIMRHGFTAWNAENPGGTQTESMRIN
jgi:broad specificity phosphatase PhoE